MTTLRITPNKPAVTARAKRNGIPVFWYFILPIILAFLWVGFFTDGPYLTRPDNHVPDYEIYDVRDVVAIDLQSPEHICGFAVNDTHDIWSTADLAPYIYPQHTQFLQDHDPYSSNYSKTIFDAVQKFSEHRYSRLLTGAVITIPPHFTDTKRQSLKETAIASGLTTQRLINRETAAGIAYDLDTRGYNEDMFLVYDLNKNHIEISLSIVEDGVFELLGNVRKPNFGFSSISDRVLEYITKEYEKTHDRAWLDDENMISTLKASIESKLQHPNIWKEPVIQIPLPHRQIPERLSSTMFSKLSEPILTSMVDLTLPLLKDVKVPVGDITNIILTGSPVSFPLHHTLMNMFSEVPKQPTINSHLSTMAVLMGAIRQARVISGDIGVSGCGSFDLVPLSIGVETRGGVFARVMHRNAILPNRNTERFNITFGEEEFVVKICEGERMFAADNKLLGNVTLERPAEGEEKERVLEVQVEMWESRRDLTLDVKIVDVTDNIPEDRRLENARLFTDVLTEFRKKAEVDAVLEDAERNYEHDMKRLEKVKVDLEKSEVLVNELVHVVKVYPPVKEKPWYECFGWWLHNHWTPPFGRYPFRR